MRITATSICVTSLHMIAAQLLSDRPFEVVDRERHDTGLPNRLATNRRKMPAVKPAR